jgi:hypothetical protein
VVYAVTLGKPRRVSTPQPTVRPELEILRGFRWRAVRGFAALVKFARRRVYIERRIEQLERQWPAHQSGARRRQT